jgi:hypothetical protein
MRKIFLCIIQLVIINVLFSQNNTSSFNARVQAKEQQALINSSLTTKKNTTTNSLPEQDCSNAIMVCQPTFSVVNSYLGEGVILENINSSCLGAGEKNSVWYTLSTNSGGSVQFLITPNNLSDDYDYALYDITSNNCNDINSGLLQPIRCNFSAAAGVTGLSASASNTSEPASGSQYSSVLNTITGKTYVLIISNYSISSFGYVLDFSTSTAGIYTGAASSLHDVVTFCGTDSLKLNLSRPVSNMSIASDGSDFLLSGTGGPYVVSSAQGVSSINSTQVNIKFTPQLTGLGPWTLDVLAGNDNNTLLETCSSQSTAVSAISFTTQPLTSVAGPAAVCKGSTFTLSASPAVSYTWSGSLVTSSQINQQVISVTTNSVGVFSFSVSSNSTCGSFSSVKNVNIGDFPTANFSLLTLNPVCVGALVSFSNTSVFPCTFSGAGLSLCNCGSFACSPTSNQVTAANYNWNFGDTTQMGIGYNVPHTYTNPGTYVVSLQASNLIVNASCVSTKTIVITVNPTATITVNSGSICNGSSFTITPSGASTYTYSNGSDVVTPTADASYSVSGTDANGCISLTDAISTVTVNSLPTITVNSGSICNGQSFTMIPSGASTYTYSSGSDVVIPSANDSFTVTGTGVNGCTNTAVSSVSVNALPIITVNSVTVCPGSSATLTAGGAQSYSWSPYTSLSSSTGSVVISYASASTIYTVTGTDTSSGCSGLTSALVSVLNSTPISIVAGSSSNSICIGSCTNLFAAGSGGTAPYTYSWTPNIGAFNMVNDCSNASITYTVKVSDANGCSNSASITVAVDNTCQDVWPGDANSDGIADNLDVLELGLHYTQTGAPRASSSNIWQSYYSTNWAGTITNAKNLNHSDCNGDGIINDDDTLAIYNNYGLTHTFKPAQTTTVNPQLSIVPDQASVVKGTWGTSSIYLGDAGNAISNINGLAFTVDFDNTLIEPNSIWLEYPSSFINAVNQNLHFRKLDFGNAKIFTATTHTLNNNVSGNGLIGILHYKIKSSLTTDEVLNIGLV